MPPVDRQAYEATVSAVRAAPGDAALSVAWATGEASPLNRVLADAAQPPSTTTSRPGTGHRKAVGGRAALTDRREFAVAERIALGLTNREIASDLTISVRTADRHVVNILDKLGQSTRAQVAAWVVAQRG